MFSRYSKVFEPYLPSETYLSTCGFPVKHQVEACISEVLELLYRVLAGRHLCRKDYVHTYRYRSRYRYIASPFRISHMRRIPFESGYMRQIPA